MECRVWAYEPTFTSSTNLVGMKRIEMGHTSDPSTLHRHKLKRVTLNGHGTNVNSELVEAAS